MSTLKDRKQLIQKPHEQKVFHVIHGNEGEYQMDIAFLKYSEGPKYLKINDGYTCILLAVEVPTRFAYGIPMRTKNHSEVNEAFEKMHTAITETEKRPFTSVTTDSGSEFNNRAWDAMIARLKVKQYVKEPGDRFSLGIIDRLTRTLKTWIEDWQIMNESLSWIEALPEIVERYNEHQVRTLHSSPSKLRDSVTALELAQLETIQRNERAVDAFLKFSIGDHVRIRLRPTDQPRAISRLAKPSENVSKGITRWSNKVYVIRGIEGWSFVLEDLMGKKADRTYRHYELMKVSETSRDVEDIFVSPAHQARTSRRKKREGLD